ncbi:MAG: DUF898 domain-containing protein [Aquabacterium sp.]|nr:MAG: DUF898 domain-containing protein [Aquabacterium sp.]
MDLDVNPGGPTAGTPDAPRVDNSPRYFQIDFTGSGSEYFRIWIVNLLLTIVTLGLYAPWAKVRKLKYFYGNTHVGGHTLDFHGSPKRMLRGYLLVGAMFLAVNVSGRISPIAGGVAIVLMVCLWPALVRASLQFRLANTSWRGMRFRFSGTMADAYKAFLLPMLVFAAFFVVVGLLAPHPGGIGPDGEPIAPAAPDPLLGQLMAILTLAFYGVMPYFWYRLKRYQHDHYGFAQLQTKLRAGAGSFYKLFLKSLGVLVLCGLVFGVLVAIGGMGGAIFGRGPGAIIAMIPFFILGAVLLQAVPYPYFVSRMQNLLWSSTGSNLIRFKSELPFKAFFLLTLKNWFLTVLTLGFYWPFAAIATTRMKLQAMSIHTRVDLDALASEARAKGNQDASGDVAADLFGIDFGL